jgi:hypothetical protein
MIILGKVTFLYFSSKKFLLTTYYPKSSTENIFLKVKLFKAMKVSPHAFLHLLNPFLCF